MGMLKGLSSVQSSELLKKKEAVANKLNVDIRWQLDSAETDTGFYERHGQQYMVRVFRTGVELWTLVSSEVK